MSDKMREALQRMSDATEKLLADMRERALLRGDYDTEDGRKIAILDCGSSVLLGLHAARDMARAALAEQPAQGEAICSADGCRRRKPCGPYCRDNGNLDSLAPPAPAVPPVSDDWKARFSSVFWLLENDRSQWLANDSGEFTDDVHKAWKFVDEATANRARAALPHPLSITKPTEHMIADAARPEHCSHARTFNGRLCCDCGAEVDPATQNFGRYGTAPAAPVVPDEQFLMPDSGQQDAAFVRGWNACRAAMLAAAPEVKP